MAKKKEKGSLSPEEFLEQVCGLGVTLWFNPKKDERKYSWERGPEIRATKKGRASLEDFLYEKWVTGGDNGGSCWDEGERHSSPISGEPEPEFDCFDKVLLHFAPEIPYLKYKAVAAVVEHDTYTENEYYGNYTNFGTKKIVLKALYDKLVELDLI